MKLTTRQLTLCAVLTALALALLNPMLAWINVTPAHHEVYTAAHTYCAIIFAGIGAQLFYNFICSFLRSMGDSVTPLAFLLFSTVLNVGLDLLFIMVFRWGVAGAAIATVAAQLISTVACFIYAFAKYPQLRLHREDMRITRGDIRRHVVQGVPLGLQFSVLAIGIIVMQGVVVQFDMLDGVMVSSSAQMGFGAANKLFNLTATPMNALGTAMTSFTAQNLGAGNHDRIRKGTLQSLVMVSLLAAMAVGIGLLLTLGNAYLRIFLSADKITMDTVRYGNTFLYVDYAMYLFLGFIFPSIFIIAKEEYACIQKKWQYTPFVILGIAIVAALTYMNSKVQVVDVDLTHFSVPTALYLFLAGVVAITAMFLPGISGSTVLLIFGVGLIGEGLQRGEN